MEWGSIRRERWTSEEACRGLFNPLRVFVRWFRRRDLRREALAERITDLPFKLGDRSIVIIKDVPVLQCPHCHSYLLRDPVMAHVERLLESASQSAELAILRYAA